MNYLADEWTKERTEAFHTLLKGNESGREGVIQQFENLSVEHKLWALQTLTGGRIDLLTGAAFIVPVLSEEYCAKILKWSNSKRWSENIEESEAYRMPEMILAEHDPRMDAKVKEVLLYGLAPWMQILFGKLPDDWNSVQLTKYNPVERSGGNYHVDSTSDYTAVIAMNTGEFEGGGTMLYDGCMREVFVPPLPTGYALVFRGKDIFHKGCHVKSGDRMLLTIWCEDKPCA